MIPDKVIHMQAKILIVEDNPDSREVFRIQIEYLGYEVIAVESGEECIERALVEKPDLIIMDIGLPGMNGIEATIVLKQNSQTSQIPIIAHSAWKGNKNEALKAGMVEFLPKHPLPAVFEEVIQRVLQSKGEEVASTK